MSSLDELRSYAVDCARLARGAAGPEEKARLLNIAQAWTDLAARVERLGRPARAPDGSGVPEASTRPKDAASPS